MRKNIVVFPAFCMLVAVILSGCGGEDYKKTVTPVRVETPALSELNSAVSYTASVNPYTQVELDFKVEGYVQEILQTMGANGKMRDIQAGDEVPKGTPLAVIDQTEYLAKVIEAESRLKQAQASLQKETEDFGRTSILYSKKSVTAPDYDRVRKDYKSAQAQVVAAEANLVDAKENLGFCTLRAPMNGVIISRDVNVGSYVRPGTQGFVIADVTSVKAVFSIPDVALGDVSLGQEMAVTTEAVKDTIFMGTVTEIAPSASTRTRVFNVEITIPNPENLLKPGMIAALGVAEGSLERDIMLVPFSSVVRSANNRDGYAVYVIEDKKEKTYAKIVDVSLGSVFGNRIAVTSGLSPGDRVITTGAQIVQNGDQVSIIP